MSEERRTIQQVARDKVAIRCKSCNSDQMAFVQAEMTVLGMGNRYRCRSCGQESIRVNEVQG